MQSNEINLRVGKDDELHGVVILGDTALSMVRTARACCEGNRRAASTNAGFGLPRWTGRELADWAALEESFGRPWAEGLATIREFRDELAAANLPTPKTRKRRARWSDTEGEIDPDRVLAGEPAFYRDVKRDDIHGPTTITILCQMGGVCKVAARDLFWRGAAAAALVDILEAAGYSCEVVVWSRADGCYDHGQPDVFRSFRLKEAGDPLDLDTLACGLSSWFFRLVMLGVTYAANVVGQTPSDGKGTTNHYLGGYRKYLDVDDGKARVLELGGVYSRDEALAAARAALESLTQPAF
jgi:hypothetical protein